MTDNATQDSSNGTPDAGRIFTLNDWVCNPLDHTLVRGEIRNQIPAKAMRVLEYIVRNHDRLVTREELIDAIWDGNSYVGEKSLTNAIWQIRRALNGQSDDSELIKTVSKTGYQLVVAPVYVDDSNTPVPVYKRPLPLIITAVLAIAIVIIATTINDRQQSRDAVNISPSVLVELQGREVYPAVSADGKAIAFTYVTFTHERNIYVRWMDGRENAVQQLTFSELDDLFPTWSPDSVHIAFLRVNVPLLDQCEVVVLNIHTGQEHILSPCIDDSETMFPTLSWSPDGQWLVFRADEAGNKQGLYLWPVDVTGNRRQDTQPTRISCANCQFTDHYVSWSPDSSKLAVTRRSNRLSHNLYVYSLQSGEFEPLTTDERRIEGHAWFSDGNRLVYASDKQQRDTRLWALDTTTGAKHEIGVDAAAYPTFTPDYQSLVMHRRARNTHIAALSLGSSGGPRQMIKPIIQTAHAEGFPTYDPRRDRIAFVSNGSGRDEIWIANHDGSNPLQLTHLGGGVMNPTWSPNGRFLAFIAKRSEENTNFAMYIDIDSGQSKIIPSEFGDHGPPSWSADGQSLVVPIHQNGQYNLWRISLDGKVQKQITATGAEFGREDRYGDNIYYTKSGRNELFSIDATGSEIVVWPDFDSGYGLSNWDWYSDDEIVHTKSTSGEQTLISLLNLNDSTSTNLVEFPPRTIHEWGRLSYSAKHDSVLFTHYEMPEIDLWIMPSPLE